MVDIKSLNYKELSAFVESLSQPAYRAKQIWQWLYRGVCSFDEMTNLSKAFIEKLKDIAFVTVPQIEKKSVSSDGTIKYLFKLSDGEMIESVLMEYKHAYSLCISTQVGCKQGCSFCASTIGGVVRNLTVSELSDQIIFVNKDLDIRIGSVVLMGIGEPLDNFDNVIKFLYNINLEHGLNLGLRHISVSTCGLVLEILRLAQLSLPVTLSVSLHAPNDEIRNKIMPVNRKHNVKELMSACRHYLKATKRRISFEYTLISGVNDSEEDAAELAVLLKGMLCHVNLIRINKVEGKDYVSPDDSRVRKFESILNQKGINTTVRRRLGTDIEAACGQLRRKNISSKGR